MRRAMVGATTAMALALVAGWLAMSTSTPDARAAGSQARLVAPPKPGSPPFPDCPAIGVIGSRGSGETPTKDWGQGLGPPPLAFAQDLGALRSGVEYTYNAPPGYPAVKDIPTIVLSKGTYVASVVGGEIQLRVMLHAEQAKCPSTRLILTGYSQGAELTADAYLAEIGNASILKSIAGIVLFGDPLYNHTDPADTQTALQQQLQGPLKHNGAATERFAPWHLGAPHSFPGSTIGRVLSYCLPGDYVCQGVIGNNPFNHQHSRYATSPYPEDAAQYFSSRIGA